jgi:trans-aconitate methyltransferase
MFSSMLMQFINHEPQPVLNEIDVIDRMLTLNEAHILELRCGAVEKTRLIAEKFNVAGITAVEIDSIQHGKNLQITDMHH